MEESQQPNRKLWASVLIFIGGGVPAIVLRISGAHMDPIFASLLYGLGIVAGAFLLSWAAEVAQIDISASFAIALLALIAILPEYAIEAVLALQAGASYDPVTAEFTDEMGRVAANVTGSNRLLIGLGWSLVILIYWLKRRNTLDMRGTMGLEMTTLAIATLLTALIFIFGQVNLVLAVGLILLFVIYLWISSTREAEEPDLVGVARLVGSLPAVQRRTVAVAFLVYAAAIILIAAEPFVEGLVETGADFGIDEFILIQWLAPLASESPEIIVATLFALRSNPTAGLTTLISAEVNQLTLLVGTMVVIFSASAGQLLNFPLDDRQSIEFMLTTAVSAFAILLIAPRVLHWWMGALLLTLFIAHLFFPDPDIRRIFAFVYFFLAAVLAITDRTRVLHLFSADRSRIRAMGEPNVTQNREPPFTT